VLRNRLNNSITTQLASLREAFLPAARNRTALASIVFDERHCCPFFRSSSKAIQITRCGSAPGLSNWKPASCPPQLRKRLLKGKRSSARKKNWRLWERFRARIASTGPSRNIPKRSCRRRRGRPSYWRPRNRHRCLPSQGKQKAVRKSSGARHHPQRVSDAHAPRARKHPRAQPYRSRDAARRNHRRRRAVFRLAHHRPARDEFAREVFGVPGNATQAVSFAPDLLIKQGAKLVTNAEDVRSCRRRSAPLSPSPNSPNRGSAACWSRPR
jgi:hypothetical protein